MQTDTGGRRRGRQRKPWENNTKEWIGFEWNILLQKAENREEWRKLQWCPNGQPDNGIDKIRRRRDICRQRIPLLTDREHRMILTDL